VDQSQTAVDMVNIVDGTAPRCIDQNAPRPSPSPRPAYQPLIEVESPNKSMILLPTIPTKNSEY
jgi:hypothetical protein